MLNVSSSGFLLLHAMQHDVHQSDYLQLRILYTSQIIMGGVASRLQGGEAIRRVEDSGEEVKTHIDPLGALI